MASSFRCLQNKEAPGVLHYPTEHNWSVLQHHAVPSYKVGSTLTMPLPMQGGCNFIVGCLLFYCEFLSISFHFIFISIPAFITCRSATPQNLLAIKQDLFVYR